MAERASVQEMLAAARQRSRPVAPVVLEPVLEPVQDAPVAVAVAPPEPASAVEVREPRKARQRPVAPAPEPAASAGQVMLSARLRPDTREAYVRLRAQRGKGWTDKRMVLRLLSDHGPGIVEAAKGRSDEPVMFEGETFAPARVEEGHVPLNVRVLPSTRDQVKAMAADAGMSLNAFMDAVVRAGCGLD